ncbi:MAG TPA: S16 family serine protease [Actinomycetota bacterium]|nr:S16 family serine protease [Actinomycetota bacterium]
MSRRLLALLPALTLLLCLYAVPVPLFVESPGPAHAVVPRIDIDEVRTYQPAGRMLLTTVNVGRVNLLDAVRAWIDPTAQVVPEREIFPPGQTEREFERLSRSQMDQSKIAAVAVALRRLTGYPRRHGPGALVYATQPRLPAHGRLFPGDLIVRAGGERVGGVPELRRSIRRAGVGGRLRLTVRPVEGGDRRSVRLRPVAAGPESEPRIGILPVANFPFPVVISSGRIGGPSAGLMWALGVIDLLEPGDLGGGRTLAGTGALDLEGRVYPIGGIGLKIAAAERAGAGVFLVPRGNLDEAEQAAETIELVPVRTVTDALRYLEGERHLSGELDT